MRRRTRPRVVWLPQTNRNSIGDLTTVFNLVLQNISGATGSSTTTEIPIVLDNQQIATGTTDSSLADIESSGYRLRRIVGKVWCQLNQTNLDDADNTVQSVICTAGFMVRKATAATGDSYAAAVGPAEVDPALIGNTGDPWIWRRSWVLGNNAAAGVTERNPPNVISKQHFPTVNWGKDYPGGIAEGPHIDQKTARKVGPEERLFLAFTTTVLGEAVSPPGDANIVAWFTDLRVLGSLQTSSGNRGNSTR